MTDDLKNYRATRLFDWVSEEPALIVLLAFLAACVIEWAAR